MAGTTQVLKVETSAPSMTFDQRSDLMARYRSQSSETVGFWGGAAPFNESIAVPEGHYEDESMKSTVVPNRNMILLSIATAGSIASGLEGVAYAAHAGDHAIYPDCRPAFADAMNEAIKLCDYTSQRLVRPFVSLTKADIVKAGAALGVPFERTWSCYNGGATHCGKCGTCVERIEAFKLAGVSDPTDYQIRVDS